MKSGATAYRILVVDDSRIFREAVRSALHGEPDMVVAGMAGSGKEAIEFLRKNDVDVVTLDVEMPPPDGLQTLGQINELFSGEAVAKRPGVIMVSSYTKKGAQTTITALENGAFDFINKPAGMDKDANQEALKRQLLVKIRCLVSRRNLTFCHSEKEDTNSNVLTRERQRAGTLNKGGQVAQSSDESVQTGGGRSHRTALSDYPVKNVKAIVIGVSTGGPKALSVLVPQLCRYELPPVVIVQHMPAEFTASLAASLDKHCSRNVCEAKDGQMAESGTYYIAPGGKHLILRKAAGGRLVLSTNDQPPENGCRPSVDVLFRSAAVAVSGHCLALILTGMGEDGCRGLGPLKRAGAYVIAQDEETSVVWGMPGSAVRASLVDSVLPLEDIAEVVGKICI